MNATPVRERETREKEKDSALEKYCPQSDFFYVCDILSTLTTNRVFMTRIHRRCCPGDSLVVPQTSLSLIR